MKTLNDFRIVDRNIKQKDVLQVHMKYKLDYIDPFKSVFIERDSQYTTRMSKLKEENESIMKICIQSKKQISK